MVDLGIAMILVVFGALLVCLGFWVAYVFMRPLMPRQGTSMADLLREAIHVTPDHEDDEEPVQEEGEEGLPSLPVDPDNPPLTRTYHRQPGRPVRTCHCHGRPLEDGEPILFWPNPEVEGAFWLVCHPEVRPEVVP